MSIGIKKILYAADANESVLAEAQEYLAQALYGDQDNKDAENNSWSIPTFKFNNSKHDMEF